MSNISITPRTMQAISNVGGNVATYWIMPSGSSWTDFTDIYNSAHDGDVIVLPNETIIQPTWFWIDKPITIMGDPRGSSVLKVTGQITDPTYGGGTGHQFGIGKYTETTVPNISGIRFTGFTIEHDRIAAPDMRVAALDIAYAGDNVEIDHMTFRGITSDVIDIRPWDGTGNADRGTGGPFHDGICNNISIHNNLVDEWWEGFVDLHQHYLNHVHVFDNVGTATTQHSGFQGPMALEVNIEQQFGWCKDVVFANNHFTLSGAAQGGTFTIGAVVNSSEAGQSGFASPSSNDVTYYDVVFANNILDGFATGIYLADIHLSLSTPLPTTKTNIIAYQNQILNTGLSLYIWPDSSEPSWRTASPNDSILLFQNNWGGGSATIDFSRLTGGDPYLLNVGNV